MKNKEDELLRQKKCVEMCHIKIKIENILPILYSHTFLNFTENQNVSHCSVFQIFETQKFIRILITTAKQG